MSPPAKFLNELFRPGCNVSWELYGVNALEDDVVCLHGVGAGERWGTGEELKHEDAEGPVVGRDVMALVEDHFRGNVFRSSAESPGLPSNLNIELD